MISDRLLSEVERQKKYLDRLPKDFQFPLFNAMQALESQRRNGYRNSAAAARDMVDNSIEAGATRIHVVFETKKQGRQVVTAVAFIDNGSGMLPAMARFALSWGGGTHFDDPLFVCFWAQRVAFAKHWASPLGTQIRASSGSDERFQIKISEGFRHAGIPQQ
jgi:hypothetical protein